VLLVGKKGGAGTTVVATALALVLARRDTGGALLVDLAGDVPAVIGHDDRLTRGGGQATVEAALVLPVVALLLLAVIQIGLLVRAEVLVTHAAREAARAAAVDAHPDAARNAAISSSSLDARRLTVLVQGRNGPGSRAQVEVVYDAPTDVPLVGGLLGDVTLRATATMRVE
jgi:Flp pilus assembly protein TadG